MSDVPIEGTPDPAAVVAENQALQRKLDKYEGEKRVKRVRLRKILVGILVVLTCLSITATTIDTWAHRTLLNTDAWVDTVGPLGTDPQVTAALANFVTTQIVTTLDLEQRAQDALEQAAPQAAFLAAPITNAIEGFVHDKMVAFFDSSAWATLWTEANRFAHQTAVNILRGREGTDPDQRERDDHAEPHPRDHRSTSTDPGGGAGDPRRPGHVARDHGHGAGERGDHGALVGARPAAPARLRPDHGLPIRRPRRRAGRGHALRQAHVRADHLLVADDRRSPSRCRSTADGRPSSSRSERSWAC